MAEIKHRVGIRGGGHDMYPWLTTVAGLAKWWTSNTRGAGSVGSIFG